MLSIKKSIVAAAIVGALALTSVATTAAYASVASSAKHPKKTKAAFDGPWHSVNLSSAVQHLWDTRADDDVAERLSELDIRLNSDATSQIRVKNDYSYAAVTLHVLSSDANDQGIADADGNTIESIQPFNRYSTLTVLYSLGSSITSDLLFAGLDPSTDVSDVVDYGDYTTLITDNMDLDAVDDDPAGGLVVDTSGIDRFDFIDGVLETWDSDPNMGPWNTGDDCSSAPYVAQLAKTASDRECELIKNAQKEKKDGIDWSSQAVAGDTPDDDLDRSISCMGSVLALMLWNQAAPQLCVNADSNG